MQQKQTGRKQKSKPYNDSDDVYDFAYKIQNATSVPNRSEKITPHDKEKIWQFIDHLKALRLSKGRIAKYIYHLKTIGENLGLEFEAATRKDIDHKASNRRDVNPNLNLLLPLCSRRAFLSLCPPLSKGRLAEPRAIGTKSTHSTH